MNQEDKAKYTPRLKLIRHTGVILLWFQQSYSFVGTPEELRTKLQTVTLKNIIFGWWSPVSLVVNPIVTLWNFYSFKKYKRQLQ